MKPLLLCALLVCTLPMAQAQTAPAHTDAPLTVTLPAQSQGLKISIAPTSQSSQKGEGQVVMLHRSDPHINVVLQNVSAQPLRIFQEWNSWGAYNLVLQISAVDGVTLNKPIRISKGEMIWDANAPTTDSLSAGDALVREIRLHLPPQFFDPATPSTTSEINHFGPLYWDFPFPAPNNSRTLTMSAVFANDDANKNDKAGVVWTGRIASPPQNYRFFWLD